MAENGDGVVVRMYEDSGVARNVSISTAFEGTAYETNLIEEVIGDIDLNNVSFKPFEIKTIIIK